MTSDVTIVDYGVGNIASIVNMLKKAGFTSDLASDKAGLERATRILLPGVGAFDHAAIRLGDSGLREVIVSRAAADVPILGVCLGMQLLLDASEEGVEHGLGLIPGTVRRFPREAGGASLRVPHMGWNTVRRVGSVDVLPGVEDDDRFYFVHSYFADPVDPSHRLGVTTHGVEFASMISRGRVTGVQFHPEKSHRMGMRLLSDFARA